jgi:predicted amidohydrolase
VAKNGRNGKNGAVAKNGQVHAAGETTISAVAMHCSHDPEANWKKYLAFVDEAAGRGSDYLVFPEVSLHGYLMGSASLGSPEMSEQLRYFRRVAEPVPGPTTDRLTALAAKHNMLIQAGLAERAMDGNMVYNSAVLVGPQGVIGVFRKLHNQFEWPVFGPGDHLSVFETRLGKIGMFICYDLAFPEITRAFALQGATIAALTTAWPMKGDDPETDYYGYTYDLLSRAMALANQMWMVCSNQVLRPPTPGCANYYGHSRIIAPTGKIVAEIGHEEGLATATVDLHDGIERGRTLDFFGLNLLEDRRPEFYGILADKGVYYQSEVAPLPRQVTKANGVEPVVSSMREREAEVVGR